MINTMHQSEADKLETVAAVVRAHLAAQGRPVSAEVIAQREYLPIRLVRMALEAR